MALMKWSNSSIDDEEEKKDGIIQVKSVQSQWQPTDENQQSQQKTRSEQDYMFSEEKAMRDEQQRQREEAERQRQLAIAEEQRQNALYAEQQRQANLANQAQQRQQAQAQQNDDYNKRVNEYVGQKIEQERKAWNDARSWTDKLFGQNSYGDTEERRTKANAIAQFKVDNTDWNNAYQVADTQRYAKSASNISNAISQSYGDYLRRADEASKSVGDLPVLGNLARLATTGSGSILDRSEANENIINNVGDIKYKTSIGKNGKQYDVEEMINFVNKGLETNSMTYLEAEELLSQVGMEQRFKIGENNTVEERSTADRTTDSSKRIISAVGNPLFSVLENTGKVAGDVADNTVGNLASGAIDMTFGNVQRMLGGDPNTDDDPNSFNALNAGDWSRLAKNLPSGMITGATGAPRKIVEGSGQIISGVANADLGHTVGGAARFGDGAIDIGGILFGGSGQMIKAITGELGEQTAKQTARKIVAQLAKGVGQEGLEEGVQDLLGQVADNNGDLSKIDLSRTLEATKQGAVGGAVMGGAGKAISGVRGRFDTNMDTQTQGDFENQLNNLGDPSEEFNSNREIVIPAPQNQLQEPNLPAVADTFTRPKQFEPIAPFDTDSFETLLGTEPSEVVSDYQSEEAPQTRELKLIEDVPEETAPAVENNAPSVENPTYTPDTITQLQNQYAGADEATQSRISGDINRLRDISGDKYTKQLEELKTAEDFLAEPDEYFDEDLPIKPKKEKDILDRFISQYDTKEVPFKALINTTLELGLADGVDFGEVITELKNYPKFLDKQGHIKPGAKKIIDRIVELERQRAKAQKQVNSLQKNANRSRKGENGSLDLENLKYTTQDQKARNHAIKQKQLIDNQMNANVMRLMSKAGLKHAFVNNLTSIIDYRKANMLLSVPSLSRNITQELAGNVANFIDNPTNSIKSLPNSFRDGFSGAKRSVEGWKNTDEFKASPHKYIMGNTYSTAMAGTQALADARFDGARQIIAEEVAKLVAEEKGVKPTKELVEFVKASGGMEMEMVARTMTGVYNASSNRFAADQMMKAYIDFIKNGDEQSHAKFMSIAEKSSTIAQALRKSAFRAKNLSNDGKSASAMMNFFAGVMDWLVPFSATATNAVSNTLYELNPFTQSVYDLFKSEAQNSNKAVVGSRIARHFMTAKVAPVVAISGMFATGMAGYNDSDEDRSKPQGFWIKFGDIYTTPRALGMDLPFAIIGVAHEMSKDISADTVDFSKYGRMISSSVPYINEMRQTNSWLTDLMSDWNEGKLFDPGYQAQTQLISTTKSLTPFANNNLYPAIRAMNGKMTNQKKMYDKDVGKHFQNMLTKSFATSDEQWNSLEDSRDATGRVRSVDLPLGFGKHEITDEQTKRYNQSVMDMNNISKKYKLGNLVGDNWNTYDEGKSNSNFNTLMGMIARTDESGWKNDHNKLIPNDKLRDLSSQIYQSVFEGKGDELLTMGGEQLFSDVKVPNSAGSKNTSLPISMNSIRDTYLMGSLTQEQNDALNAIRTEKDTNYADYSAKKISKDQYLANKDSYATREREIVSQSKNYEKWNSFWNDIKETGFFEKDGYGSTKSGQMWLWNALNNMYIKDGNNKTPATNWKDSDSSKSGGYSRRSSGGGNNLGATAKNKHGIEGIENKAKARKMTSIKGKTLTPANIKISLQNKIKKDATRNYKG